MKQGYWSTLVNRKPVTLQDVPSFEIPFEEIKISSLIGKGVFGQVYKGTCYSAPVAIKEPKVQRLTAKQLASFRKEVKIMRENPHPNICLFMGACTKKKLLIVTELLDGDLEGLLRSDQQLSLYDRMKMAKDAALGMTWLHLSNPSGCIIHRDLKTANLLYATTGKSKYKVKVCDFGLSEIKPRTNKFMKDPKDGAKGTPLFMAPEVLRGEDFDAMADVYSFGLILWEILTRKEPYEHHTDYDVFVESVCDKHERPIIPKGTSKRIERLITSCWHPNPKKRPDFRKINADLGYILVETAVGDKNGQAFWINNFFRDTTPQEDVPWVDFKVNFYSFLGEDLPEEVKPPEETTTSAYEDERLVAEAIAGKGAPTTADDQEEESYDDDASDLSENKLQITLSCVKSLFAEPTENERDFKVNIQRFGQLLYWFGPLKERKPGTRTFLDGIYHMLEKEWFHGPIDKVEAQRRLMGKPIGTFLVRFSTMRGFYTISRVQSNGQVSHIRISHIPNGPFSVTDDSKFATLPELIEGLYKPFMLKFPCQGSSFAALWSPLTSGYISSADAMDENEKAMLEDRLFLDTQNS